MKYGEMSRWQRRYTLAVTAWVVTMFVFALAVKSLADQPTVQITPRALRARQNMASTAPGTSGEAFAAFATDLAVKYGIVITHPKQLVGKGNDIKDAVRAEVNAKKQAALDLVDGGAGLKQVVEAQQEVIEELAAAIELLLHAQSFQIRVAADQ